MFVDAAALVAILAGETEQERCLNAISAAGSAFTSAIAVWEAAMALARADRLGLPLDASFAILTEFLEQNEIELRQLPPPGIALALSADAAFRFRTGRTRLNLADCFHYACARYAETPILSTADEFRFTDLQVVP